MAETFSTARVRSIGRSVGVSLVLATGLAALTGLGAAPVAEALGYRVVEVSGGRAEPALSSGDLVLASDVPPLALRPRDVVLVRGRGRLELESVRRAWHRNGRPRVATAPLSNLNRARTHRGSDVVAKVRVAIPGAALVAAFAADPWGRAVFGSIAVLALAVAAISRRRGKRRAGGFERPATPLDRDEVADTIVLPEPVLASDDRMVIDLTRPSAAG